MSSHFKWTLFVTLLAGSMASATPFVQTIGNTSSANGSLGGFINGTQVTSGQFATADSGNPAPFNGATCGADTAGTCSTSWIFNAYGPIPGGQTIISATITIGIGDLDTHAAGNQVASFSVAGVNLLTDINTAAEAGSGICVGTVGNACYNNIYQTLTIVLPASTFAQLATGTTNVSFASAAPGWGILGSTANGNGVFLDFSTLSITTDAGGGGGSTTPEPGTLLSVGLGLLGVAGYGYRRRKS